MRNLPLFPTVSIVSGVLFCLLDSLSTAFALLRYHGTVQENNHFLAGLMTQHGVILGLFIYDSCFLSISLFVAAMLTGLVNALPGRPASGAGFAIVFSVVTCVGAYGFINNLVVMAAL